MDGPWGALCISVYSLKRGRSQLTEEGIVRPRAIMADTRLMGVSIGGTTATYAPSACGGRGLLRLRHITSLTAQQPLLGWGRQAALPQPQAPGRSPIGQGKASLPAWWERK